MKEIEELGIWRCSKCGKKYRECKKCECGYVFWEDQWTLKNIVNIDTEIGKIKLLVSTVDLETYHPGGWYETMIFVNSKQTNVPVHCDYLKRYMTKKDAEKNHKRIVEEIKNGKYKVIPDGYRIKFEF